MVSCAFKKIPFKPGVNRETTSYANEFGWFNSDLIRFRKGRPEKMGGWSRLSSNNYDGTGRSLHVWAALDGSKFMGLGTEAKIFILNKVVDIMILLLFDLPLL